jgi:glycosyltransferase involved in cell wall biosynthesis
MTLYVDVVIPTKNAKNIRRELLAAIKQEPAFRRLIITRDKPLSTARKKACLEANTEWVAMFDDDVTIPHNWLSRVKEHIKGNVGAISTVAEQSDLDLQAYSRVVSGFFPLHRVDTAPHINNILVRKKLLEDYNPPKLFHCEDQLMKHHVQAKGYAWRTIGSIGVIHMGKSGHKIEAGMAYKRYDIYNPSQLTRRFIARMLFSPFSFFFTRRISTILSLWRDNVQFLVGWFKG